MLNNLILEYAFSSKLDKTFCKIIKKLNVHSTYKAICSFRFSDEEFLNITSLFYNKRYFFAIVAITK